MITKERLKKTIDSLPDKFTIDEIIEELVLLDKIEQGMNDVESGNIYTTTEARKKLDKWLK